MEYTSTRNNALRVSASYAIANGISTEGGLFVPTEIPKTDAAFIAALAELPLDIALLPPREEGACDLQVTGAPGTGIRADVFFALARAGLPLLRTYGNEPTLEEVFLRVTAEG